jgi:transposase
MGGHDLTDFEWEAIKPHPPNKPRGGARVDDRRFNFLVRENFKVGRLHVATLMKRMGIEPIYRRANTSTPAPGHRPQSGLAWLTPDNPRGIVRSTYFNALPSIQVAA